MSQISVQDLSFTYDGSFEPVFSHVSFQFDTDWRLGFTGRNGRGKTTFLNLLQGKYEYSGKILAPGIEFEYFPYPVEDDGSSTLEIVQAQCPDCMEWEILRELSLLNVDENAIYRPFGTLSNGEQTKALLAALFLKENKFLLIDEPTNHLDLEAREAVGAYLRRKQGFLLVSHDRSFLDDCVDHILAINRTNLEVQAGNFSSWWHNQELREQFERGEQERLRKDVKRLSAAAERTAKWSDAVEKTKIGTKNSGLRPDRGYIGHKSAKMMARSKAIDNRRRAAVEEKSSLLQNVETRDTLKLSPLQFHTDCLVELKNLAISYDGTEVARDISFAVRKGGRIALQGRNGCGKSSVLKLLIGEDIEHHGEIHKNSQLKISYVSQRTEMLCGTLDEYLLAYEVDGTLCRAILRKLGFSREQFLVRLENYSAGQKKKVLLARSLCEQAHLYIWDEPLNFIDVISRIQIEELLLTYCPTLLFVEHDRTFCETVSTQTVLL